MVSEPVKDGVVHQVNTIPQWLLPLWANWPLVVLGVVVIVIMLVTLLRLAPQIQRKLQALDVKMGTIGDLVGENRTKTLQLLQGLRTDVCNLNDRVGLLEKKPTSDYGDL